MTKQIPIIKTQQDAGWYLVIADELDPPLPVDLEVERLNKKGILSGKDDVKRAARRAVYDAMQSAVEGPTHAVRKQEGRKKTPAYLSRIRERVDIIIDNYEEIHSTLYGNHSQVALNHLEEELTSRFPEGKGKKVVEYLRFSFREFCSFQECLHDFRNLLHIGERSVAPKRGRPKETTYYFIDSLALSWFKLTGTAPVRVYDVIKNEETGDFFKFCLASANTVKEVVPFGSLDAAVRKVCDQWRLKDRRSDL